MDRTKEYNAAFAVTLLHTGLLLAGFLILVSEFSFPGILRASAQERLALFTAHQSVIVPAYYMMGLSSVTQIALAILFHQSFARPGSTVLLAALIAGVLAGAFQAMGFFRWPIAVPYLAEQMAAATTVQARDTVALLEGLLNRYAGMTIGEHLGFMAQGTWTLLIGIAMLRGPLFAWVYGIVGVVLGVLLFGGALEQLGGSFEMLGMVSAPVSAAWLGWLIMCGVSLVRTRGDGRGPAFYWASTLGLAVLMGGLAVRAI